MNNAQTQLPQMNGKLFITDGGMETDFCFNKNWELPEFAAYDLLRTQKGYEALYEYYRDYALLAQQYQLGLILETPTWRANSDWGDKIGDSVIDLEGFNKKAVELVRHIKEEFSTEESPIIVSGNIGPRGDGYTPDNLMTAQEAEHYHEAQIATFAESGVDMISALTLNYVDEAVGIVRAAKRHKLQVSIAFTVETDGKLPTGESLESAISAVDAATGGGPEYYMINCAHPTHFDHLFKSNEGWLERVKGIRGNASCKSHAELDESETLDDGNPEQFAHELKDLRKSCVGLTVLGGCCGTDYRHIKELAEALTQ